MTDQEAEAPMSERDREMNAYRAMADAAMLYVPLSQRELARNAVMCIGLGALHGTLGKGLK